AVVGNISALYPLNQYVHLTSSFNTGYRLPDIADLSGFGDQGQHFRAPSDSLQSERSFSSQIGLKAQTSQFSGSVVFYRTQLTDLIDEVPGTFQGQSSYQGLPVFQQINIAQAYVHGVEAALEVPFTPAIAIYGTLVYTYGESLTDRDALSSIPPLNGRLGMRYRNKHGFWSRLEWLRSAAQSRLSQADRENPFIGPLGTPSWSVVNLHLGYDFNWGYATLGLQNVLDESYRIHGSALPGLGRTVLLSMQLGF
ncbi:MAG: TonB-dependent receptor, partial [Bacteroidota bacterium]